MEAHTPKSKPDARPMRLALAAGGVAAFSALAAAIVLPPKPATAPVWVEQPPAAADGNSTSGTVQVQRPIQYVQLAPGQTAPPGATVIDANAPTPVTVVVNVPAPKSKPTPIYIKTTQSGKVVK